MTILITGATSGIGKQLALDYAAEGHQVIACGRNTESLALLEQAFPEKITGLYLDVTDAAQTAEVLSAIKGIKLAILSAGVCEYVSMKNFEAAMFERVYNVNVFGVVRCIEALLPELTAGSKLVLVGSVARLLPLPRAEAYGSSKAALQYIARSLQVDLKRRGIAVQTVSPGFVDTPMTAVNTFSMPMCVSVAFASQKIRSGIEKNRTDITFPSTFGWLLKFLSRLPQRWQVALAGRMWK